VQPLPLRLLRRSKQRLHRINWHITPMQIDTRNREHGVSAESVHNCTNMDECAGYEPRQARYGRNWGGRLAKPKVVDGYSGILECPCNSRYGGDPGAPSSLPSPPPGARTRR